MKDLAVCTIITKSHLTYARTLSESIKKYNPEIEVYVLLADTFDNYFDPKDEIFNLIDFSDLPNQHNLNQMCFYYTPFELCCALRGMLHEYMYRKTSAQRWLFLDSDIMIFSSLEAVFRELENKSILLTPHCHTPVSDRQHVNPHEINILRSGVFNAGFLGLKRSETTNKFIHWFKDRLTDFSFNDPGVAEPRGLFVDQLWLNLVPFFFDEVCVLSHPGVNLGHWNLFEKKLEKDGNGNIIVDGQPLLFVHFSGWDIENPEGVSTHSPMYRDKEFPIWIELAESYRHSLIKNGYETTIHYPYAYAYFDTGEPITLNMRRFYYESLKQGQVLETSPFYLSAYFHQVNFNLNTESVHLLRLELERTQAQLSALLPSPTLSGINVAGFLKAELGIGEAARGYIASLKLLGIPINLSDLSNYLVSRAQDNTFDEFDKDSYHPINLICVNADFIPLFLDRIGSKYFSNKYNIGVWWWELPEFPSDYHEQFLYFQEIWVGSNFVHEAISKYSPIPVIKVPPIVRIELPYCYSKCDFEIDDNEFVFLFMFDFLSIFARKNPLAIINAFQKAFDPDEPVRLVVKCINGDQDVENFHLLKDKFGEHKITLIDDYLSKDDKNGLLSVCDCYISLHRSEGFGLTLAEAMFLEKPVIATGWSGNMDFMNISNSYPVKYNLIRLTKDYGPYKQGQIWAEPDISHAAQLMRHVYEYPQEAKVIAKRAAADIRRMNSPETVAKLIKCRLEAIPQPKSFQVQEIEGQLQQTKEELDLQLQQTKEELDLKINAMKTSKFWRLRDAWFRVKRTLGLPVDEQIV